MMVPIFWPSLFVANWVMALRLQQEQTDDMADRGDFSTQKEKKGDDCSAAFGRGASVHDDRANHVAEIRIDKGLLQQDLQKIALTKGEKR